MWPHVDETVTSNNVKSGAGGVPSCTVQEVPAPMDAAMDMPPAAAVSEESVQLQLLWACKVRQLSL